MSIAKEGGQEVEGRGTLYERYDQVSGHQAESVVERQQGLLQSEQGKGSLS